jgi:hypothetical protein
VFGKGLLLKMSEAGMGLRAGVRRFLSLCAVILLLPAITTAQCVSQLTVQRVFTQDASGAEKTIFAPREVLVYAAELNNSYGEHMLKANGTQFVVIFDYAVYTIPVDIPPGISTLTGGVWAPSTEGSYTVRISVYDHFCDVWVEGSTSFTIQPEPGLPPPNTPPVSQPNQLAPGWYRNSGAGGELSIIHEDISGLRVTWENSYIYPYSGDSALYWFAEVKYHNTGNQTLPIFCHGADTSTSLPAKEHIRGTTNSGTFVVEDTFCGRNPNFNGSLEPGEIYYDWAIFHIVPLPGGEVRLEWPTQGFSGWVDPWHTPFDAPPPPVCPEELGTCQPAEPGPQWTTPNAGATVPYPNDLVFEVAPVNGAVGYRFSFIENGQLVWENLSHERRLDGARYTIARDSAGHLALGFGAGGRTSWPVQVWVRAYIRDGDQYHWTEASIINITLVGFGCTVGPGGSCLDQLVNPIPPSQWPSEDEVRAQLTNIGVGGVCVGQLLVLYLAGGPAGMIVGLPLVITPDSPCVDPELINETYKQVMALFACIPKYSWEVCLLP